ncbi:MAG: 23S rRNA (pseudouridine(1915)-N(3))-methyltransferase RlmH [Clostridiales bacterium]|nr:23S rRNA (pseudouridine(1915)-N(3))-methyltransferase RlmH [Candidatus Apopatousia equi]
MEVNVITVGSLKEKYFKDAVEEYKKRIGGFCKINVVEVKDIDLGTNEGDIQKAKKLEAEALSKYKKGYCIALEIKGQTFTSEGFAEKLKNIFDKTNSTISFFIGGSNGLDKEFSDSMDMKLSFSDFTFPHQLMRVVLLEQIYRAFMINNNRTYHK